MKLSFCKYWFKFSYLRLLYSATFYRFLMRNRRKTFPWTSAGGSSKRGTSSTPAPTSTATTTTFEVEMTFLWWQSCRTSHCRAHAWTAARPIQQPTATGWETKPGTGSSSLGSKGNRFWRQRRRLEALFHKNVATSTSTSTEKPSEHMFRWLKQMQL